jgi:hypothetical protein
VAIRGTFRFYSMLVGAVERQTQINRGCRYVFMLFRSCLIVFELYQVDFKTSKRSSLRLLILRPDTERSLFNAEFLVTVNSVLQIVDNRWKGDAGCCSWCGRFV